MQSYSIESIIQSIKIDRTLIQKFWSDYSLGYITIDDLVSAKNIRQYGLGKPCSCCGKTMTRDKWSKTLINGWLQKDGWWKNPCNVTIDHRYPKSLFPELIFNLDNMELICFRCNQDKGDLFGQTISKDCHDYAARLRSKML